MPVPRWWLPFALLLAACPGSLEDPDRFFLCGGEGQPVCTTSTSTTPPLDEVFRPKCGTPGCHVGATPQSDLDLGADGIEARLINKTSTSASCNGRIFVVPGDPDRSLIFNKLGMVPPCGGPMPPIGGLSDSEREAIRLWIEAIGP